MSNLLNGDLIYINSINQDIIEDANTFLKKNTNFLEKKKDWACDIITTKDSHLNILNDIELQNLKSEILKHCDLYMRENNSFFDGFIDCSWFNLYKKHYYQEFHRHNHKIHQYISGVVYLTKNNSDIHFFINNTFEYTPKICDIIIFDSHIEHRVVANIKDDLRISLAFNFRKCQSY